jgi:hypothetical protein
MEAAVRAAGWSLPTKPLTRQESEGVLNCRDTNAPWTCVPASLTVGGVDRLLVVAVENKQADNGARMVVITGRLIATDAPAIVVKQHFCEQCADDKLGEGSTVLAQQLLRDLAVRAGHTMISVHSMPSGAQVMLDGNPVGVTDGSFNTFPGKHVVVIEKPGFEREIHELEVDDGKTAEATWALHAMPDEHLGHPPPTRPSPLVPGIAIGAGASLVAFGVYGIHLGGQDSAHDKYRYTRGTTIGYAAGLVGLGAVGVGIYLLVRGPSHSAPTATVVDRGAVIGWMRSF